MDDDLEYMDGFIEYHLMKREVYNDFAIGFAGIGAIGGDCHFCTTVKRDVRVKVLEGYKTVSYKRKFFKEDFKEFAKGSWSDDIVLSAYMGKNEIKKVVIASSSSAHYCFWLAVKMYAINKSRKRYGSHYYRLWASIR